MTQAVITSTHTHPARRANAHPCSPLSRPTPRFLKSNETQHSPTFDSGFLVMPWHPFHFPCFAGSHYSQFPAFSSRSLPGGRPTCSHVLHGLCDVLVLGFVKWPDASGARTESSWVLLATATPTGACESSHKPGGPCQAFPIRGAAGLQVALAPGNSTPHGNWASLGTQLSSWPHAL